MAIELSLNKLPWTAQIGVFVGVSLLALAGFWYYYAAPLQESLDARTAELNGLRIEINRGLTTAQRLPEFRQEVAQLESQLELLRTVLPEERDVAELLRRVNAMANESNLTIRGFSPLAVTRRQLHAEWPIGLQLEGTYHDLGDFLERISKFPRIINISGLTIRARDAQTGSATITADCTATTFVLLETPPAPAPGTPPAAGD